MTTPSQTIGPFFSHALPWLEGPLVVPLNTKDSFWVLGQVFDGAGEPVPDALVESWQVSEQFRGFGRCPTDAQGKWRLHTVTAPYLAISVFARGLLHRVVTRMYFPDRLDDVALAIPEPRRSTLIAKPAAVNHGVGYTFDIHLQGEDETVFFTW